MMLFAGADVAIFHRFVRPPYGGSNQFLLALREELRCRGVSVGGRIGRATRGAILNSYVFDDRKLARQRRDDVIVLHRIDGPLARYRGFDDGTDARIVELNSRFADRTVFQSRYSLSAHADLGLHLRDPVVIPNAVDPRIFHPQGRRASRGKLRLIATSWSDNPNKGAAALAYLEQSLDWSRFELTLVGRYPAGFERARTLPPVGSAELAALLREHDIYVTASRHEAASNALLEALACGLPTVYHASGGNAEFTGDAGIPFVDDEELPATVERLAEELEERRAAISIPSIDEIADRYLDALGMSEGVRS